MRSSDELLIGKRFGKLTVIDQPTIGNGYGRCKCQCDCGRIISNIYPSNLKTGHVKSCGCLRHKPHESRNYVDMVGKKFGHLTVVGETGERASNGGIVWKCVCECGKIVNRDRHRLLYTKYNSCGCYKPPMRGYKDDLVGLRFGKLLVKSYARKQASDGSAVWKCKCDCGGSTDVTTTNLKRGAVVSCGCAHYDAYKRAIIDKVGFRYGMLTVLELTEKRSNAQAVFKCRCDCGNIVEIPSGRLVDGAAVSCGCSYLVGGEMMNSSVARRVINRGFSKGGREVALTAKAIIELEDAVKEAYRSLEDG